MLKKINKYWLLAIIFFISLTPILWFYGKPNGTLINGVDTNFPLDPLIWLQRRFYIWNSIPNAGADFAYGTAGTFFHIVQTIPFLLGYSLQTTEILSLVFWFGMIVFSSYVFAKTILPNNKISQLLLVVFYSFNTYLFNTWENVKAANLSLVAALPFAFALLVSLSKKRLSRIEAFALAIFVGMLASGAGINPAYLASLFFGMFVLVAANILANFNFNNLLERLKDYLVVILGMLVINLFWIIPTGHYIFTSISQNHSLESIGYTNWVDSLSENTSLFNVARLQGAWDWYAVDQNTGEPLYIPYANKYFKNPIFIGFSILIPALATVSLLWRDDNRKYLYLSSAILIVTGIFLGSGTHLPSGVLFRWMVDHVPFFSLFRSPWYIFTIYLIISYATLLALLVNTFSKRINQKVVFIFASILIVGNLLYSYPLVLGRIFRPARYDSFFVNFPNYIFDSSKWLNEQNTDGRIIQYPEDEIEQYSWGYRGIESILQLSVNKEVLFSSLNSPNSPVSMVIKEFYSAVKKNQMDLAYKYAEKLNVKYIFEKDDQSTLSPKIVGLDEFPVNSFGEWNFYDLEKVSNTNKVSAINKLYAVYPYSAAAKALAFVDRNSGVINPEDSVVKENFSVDSLGKIVRADNDHVKHFTDYLNSQYKRNEIYKQKNLYSVSYIINVPQDGEYVPYLEKYGSTYGKTINSLVDGNKKTLEVISDGDYLQLKPLYLEKGQHTITLDAYPKMILDTSEQTIVNESGNMAGIEYKVSEFDPFSNYLVEVEYLHEYGANAQVVLTQSREEHKVKVHVEELNNYPTWNKVSFYYDSVKTPSTLKISLNSAITNDVLGSKVKFRNLKVQKLKENNLFLVKEPETDLPLVEVKYEKLSPTSYTGKIDGVKGNHILIFSENYSNLWKLEIPNKKVKHFTLNNYSNGYYINATDESYSFEINYWPQNLYVVGQSLSIIALISATLILLIKQIKKKLKK